MRAIFQKSTVFLVEGKSIPSMSVAGRLVVEVFSIGPVSSLGRKVDVGYE